MPSAYFVFALIVAAATMALALSAGSFGAPLGAALAVGAGNGAILILTALRLRRRFDKPAGPWGSRKR